MSFVCCLSPLPSSFSNCAHSLSLLWPMFDNDRELLSCFSSNVIGRLKTKKEEEDVGIHIDFFFLLTDLLHFLFLLLFSWLVSKFLSSSRFFFSENGRHWSKSTPTNGRRTKKDAGNQLFLIIRWLMEFFRAISSVSEVTERLLISLSRWIVLLKLKKLVGVWIYYEVIVIVRMQIWGIFCWTIN